MLQSKYFSELLKPFLVKLTLSFLSLCLWISCFIAASVYIAHSLMSDSEMLKYAYAELEESRGAIQVFILAAYFSLSRFFHWSQTIYL